jgi:hypothetical protein
VARSGVDTENEVLIKTIFAIILAVCLCATTVCGQTVDGLEWNKYDLSETVHVLALDQKQGQYLHVNLMKVKTWSLERWGFPDVPISSETRIFCVPEKAQLKTLFKLDQSAVEYRKDDKKRNYTVAWLLCDDKPNRVVVGVMTDIALTEYERTVGVKMPWWSRRGMSHLNLPLQDIRSEIVAKNDTVFPVQSILEMTEEGYRKLSPEKQMAFDRQSSILLLLVRREYGQIRMLEMLHYQGKPADFVTGVLGFRGFDHFNATYARYTSDLVKDVLAGKTPDSYLDIKAVKKK